MYCQKKQKEIVLTDTDNKLVETIYNFLILSEYSSGEMDSLSTDLKHNINNIDSIYAWLDSQIEDSTRSIGRWNQIFAKVNIKLKALDATSAQRDTVNISKIRQMREKSTVK